jgi:DNA-binding response OmpR family regulator
MSKILLVEDDTSIIASLGQYLESEGFQLKSVNGQRDALEIINKETFDIVLLDLSLADGNGYGVCLEIKKMLDIPVIFLTASGDETSVVAGFEMGADDYIAKPFRPRELVSRIKNVLRRYDKKSNVTLVEDLKVDLDKGQVSREGEEIYLSALEYRLLVIFIQNRGILLSRNKLLDDIWDIAGDFVNDNTLTVYIKRLREKIEKDPANPTIIKTVRGRGYRMD